MQPQMSVPSIAFVSTYPPTSCGLATFTTALRTAVAENRGSGAGLGVVSLVDERFEMPGSEVVHQHVTGDRDSLARAVEVLDTYDAVVFEHEYGIYGGPDGLEVLDMVTGLHVPTIVTLHTVLRTPSPNQRMIVEALVDRTHQTVVMSSVAMRRLAEGYDVDIAKVRMIPHGTAPSLGGPRPPHGERPIVLTWGLLGRGKGLETAIQSFAALKDLRPLPRYVILGKTHPKVWAAEGGAYLTELAARVHALGLDDVVEFDGRYLEVDALSEVVRGADIALLPYESTEQVTSGVLVEALAAGLPVVATAFPHAVEVVDAEVGAVVPHRDPVHMAAALREMLTDEEARVRMAAAARSIGSTFLWSAVAAEYESIAAELVSGSVPVAATGPIDPRSLAAEEAPPVVLGGDPFTAELPPPVFVHLRAMTTPLGVWEHARFATPRIENGFCTDDNARALIVISRQPDPSPDLIVLARIYLGFLEAAALPHGGFHNRRSADGSWKDVAGSDDSQGRALWALGSVVRCPPEPWMSGAALELFELQQFASPSPRANALAALGAAEVLAADPANRRARQAIVRHVEHLRVRDDRWPWPEERLSYDNARIPEGLLAAGNVLGDDRLVQSGLRLLDWLVGVEMGDRAFSFTPVGGWAGGEPRPGFDQQPVEAGAMADACGLAWRLTGEARWRELVELSARWFLGANDGGIPMYDDETGGCYDGLMPSGANLNQGAESTLSALMALQDARVVVR